MVSGDSHIPNDSFDLRQRAREEARQHAARKKQEWREEAERSQWQRRQRGQQQLQDQPWRSKFADLPQKKEQMEERKRVYGQTRRTQQDQLQAQQRQQSAAQRPAQLPEDDPRMQTVQQREAARRRQQAQQHARQLQAQKANRQMTAEEQSARLKAARRRQAAEEYAKQLQAEKRARQQRAQQGAARQQRQRPVRNAATSQQHYEHQQEERLRNRQEQLSQQEEPGWHEQRSQQAQPSLREQRAQQARAASYVQSSSPQQRSLQAERASAQGREQQEQGFEHPQPARPRSTTRQHVQLNDEQEDFAQQRIDEQVRQQQAARQRRLAEQQAIFGAQDDPALGEAGAQSTTEPRVSDFYQPVGASRSYDRSGYSHNMRSSSDEGIVRRAIGVAQGSQLPFKKIIVVLVVAFALAGFLFVVNPFGCGKSETNAQKSANASIQTAAVTPSLPTPIMAQSAGLTLHSAVPMEYLTEVLIHNASYAYASEITTKLAEATNTEIIAAHGTGRVASEQPTGNEWMTGEFIRCYRSGNAGPTMSAIDCGGPVGTTVYAPVSGTVVLVKEYMLYEQIEDYRIHIQPDGRPDLDVVLIHLTDVTVKPGDKVIAGQTPIARIRDVEKFLEDSMQLKQYTSADDRGNHTHIQVNNANHPEYHGLDDLKQGSSTTAGDVQISS